MNYKNTGNLSLQRERKKGNPRINPRTQRTKRKKARERMRKETVLKKRLKIFLIEKIAPPGQRD